MWWIINVWEKYVKTLNNSSPVPLNCTFIMGWELLINLRISFLSTPNILIIINEMRGCDHALIDVGGCGKNLQETEFFILSEIVGEWMACAASSCEKAKRRYRSIFHVHAYSVNCREKLRSLAKRMRSISAYMCARKFRRHTCVYALRRQFFI